MLQEKKARLEETLTNLRKEQADISSHLQPTVSSNEHIEDIKAFCDEIRDWLENAAFEPKRQLIEMLDVRGTLAIENEEKVIYVKCHLGQQLVSVARTLPLSSTGNRQQVTLITARIVVFRFAIPVHSPNIDIASELNSLVLVDA